MLTAEGCRARRRRLWDALQEKPDWLLIFDPQHQMYLANYFQSPFVFRSANAAAVLILGADGTSILACDSMCQGFAAEAHVDEVHAETWYDGKRTAPHREARLIEIALGRLAKCPGRNFGCEMAQVPVGVVESLRKERREIDLTPIDSALHALKRRKDPDELAIMRRSIAAGDAAHAAALREIKPGMSEFQAYLLVLRAAHEAAGEQVQVYGDFVSGPRCEKEKGGPPSQRKIERGDLVLLDFSVVMRGYRGDFANTFVCDAKPTDEQRRLHDACLQALAAAEKLIVPGRPGKEIDEAVRASFDRQHLRATFTTHTGHGVGLGHPDAPYLTPDSSDTLVAGDVIAIEPGQYVPGVGGMRYERNYLVTTGGYETLSKLELRIDQPV